MTKFGISLVAVVAVLLLGVGFFITKPNDIEAPVSPNPIVEPTPVPPVIIEPKDKVDAGYVSGHITIGPFCPVEREGVPCPVPPEAYSMRSVIVYKSDATTILKKGTIDSQGNYKITLDAGNYFIQIDPAGIGPGEKKLVTIKPFKTTALDFDIDTGIR